MKKILYGVMAAAMLGGAAWADTSAVGTTNLPSRGQASDVGSDSRIDAEGQMGTSVSKSATDQAAEDNPDVAGSQANNSIEGTVSKVKHDKIMLDGQKDAIYLNDSSTIMKGGRVATRSDIKKGCDVRVSFDLKDGKKWANTVMLEAGSDTTKAGSMDTKSNLPADDTTNPSKY